MNRRTGLKAAVTLTLIGVLVSIIVADAGADTGPLLPLLPGLRSVATASMMPLSRRPEPKSGA